jgi:neutral ceramidase
MNPNRGSYSALPVVISLALLVALAASAGAQTGSFQPGTREIFSLDLVRLEPTGLPKGVSLLTGSPQFVDRGGVRMMKSVGPVEFLIRLNETLPARFTLEFDVVSRNGNIGGPEFAFEGTPALSRSPRSAQVAWSHQRVAIYGGGIDRELKLPEGMGPELMGQFAELRVAFDGPASKLLTNGEVLYDLPNLPFPRGRVLRVFMHGVDDNLGAFYLAKLRIAEGGGVTIGTISQQPGPAPTAAPTLLNASPPTATALPVPAQPAPPAPPLAPMGPLPTGPGGPPGPTMVQSILVGTGISDITGPVAEVGMMGYGKFDQPSMGLHTRLYARAFIFAVPNGKRVVFVSAELGMMFSSVKQGVLKKLGQLYSGTYDDRNVMLSATHTHAGPGGYSHYAMYNLTTLGHVAQNYAAVVDGITEAIVQAHNRLAPATLSVAAGNIVGSASANRSMPAYILNPDARSIPAAPSAAPSGPRPLVPAPPPSPAWPDSVNPEMTVLSIHRGGTRVGAIAWFAVHNTSMTLTNLLVSSDHKGRAAYYFEKANGSIAPLKNYGGFVAAFPNGAEGDMSPNIAPGFKGPGADEFQSTEMIGYLEYATAEQLFIGPNQTPVTGDIDFRHSFVLMPGLPVPSTTHTNGVGLKFLCPGAYGASFMAGAEDGPTGMLSEGLALGSTMSFAELTAARALITGLVAALMPPLGLVITPLMAGSSDPCQEPKPVLIPSGGLHWTPDILPFQLLRIGPLAIAGIPGEMTVQAGRRLQARILTALAPVGVQRVILTGLANEYSGYITTPEEFNSQQYEGASTLFGRLTFEAYLQEFGKLADAMAGGQAVAAGPTPPDLGVGQLELQQGVVRDEVPAGESFGQVLVQPDSIVSRAPNAQVHVIFRSGHPKNDLRRNNTFFRIERDLGGGNWELVAWDSMPETKFFWGRPPNCPGNPCYWSSVGVNWMVPPTATPGTYRIRLVGSWKNGSTGALVRYQGTTIPFLVQ